MPLVGDLDVGRLQIAMDDAALVRGIERVGNLSRRSPAPRRSACAAALASDAGDDLAPASAPSTSSSTSAWTPSMLFEPVDRRDVGMIERRKHARFALEARQPIGIERNAARQDLQRDVAAELRVVRAIDLAHPADAEEGLI